MVEVTAIFSSVLGILSNSACSLTFIVSNKGTKRIAIELTDDIEIAQCNFH
jgi:hypothetical protein